MKRLGLFTLALSALFATVAVGCGGESAKPPANKPEVKTEATTTPPPAASEETPPPPPATSASAATPPPPPPPSSSERPPVLMSDETELRAPVSMSPGAKFEIGDDTGRAIFRIREGALSSAHVFTFKVDPKAKTTGVPVGKTYSLLVQIENSSETPKLDTVDKPFEFTFPTAGKKGVNLAIGEITTDAKGVEKITWSVVAPEKVDESMNTAFFKLPSVGRFIMHLTLKAVTAPAAK